MHRFKLIEPGPRPPYYKVAEHLWGAGCNFDSDGDTSSPEATDWTELTIISRSDPNQRVDIDPHPEDGPLVLVIRSEHLELAKAVALFLQREAGGVLG